MGTVAEFHFDLVEVEEGVFDAEFSHGLDGMDSWLVSFSYGWMEMLHRRIDYSLFIDHFARRETTEDDQMIDGRVELKTFVVSCVVIQKPMLSIKTDR